MAHSKKREHIRSVPESAWMLVRNAPMVILRRFDGLDDRAAFGARLGRPRKLYKAGHPASGRLSAAERKICSKGRRIVYAATMNQPFVPPTPVQLRSNDARLLAVAAYMFHRLDADYRRMSPMKLNQLVCLAHGLMMALYGKPLLSEPLRTLECDPTIIRNLYKTIRERGDLAAVRAFENFAFTKKECHAMNLICRTQGQQNEIALAAKLAQPVSVYDIALANARDQNDGGSKRMDSPTPSAETDHATDYSQANLSKEMFVCHLLAQAHAYASPQNGGSGHITWDHFEAIADGAKVLLGARYITALNEEASEANRAGADGGADEVPAPAAPRG